MKIKLPFIYIVILLLTSCKKNLPDIGKTSAQPIANEWWVTLTLGGVDQLGTHVKLATYNTSADNGEIWVDDLQNIWPFKIKAQANYSNLTFNATAAKSDYSAITVDLANGKVLSGLGRSKSGNVTDSIYMEATFSDDPGNTYVISGHARTRFSEDDY